MIFLKKIQFIFLLILCQFAFAQKDKEIYIDANGRMFAETKQISQFFSRFNNNEDLKGVAYNDTNKRNNKQRELFIAALFNAEKFKPENLTSQKFIQQVCNKKTPQYLQFLNDEWLAEVKANFVYYGAEKEMTLFFKIEKSGKGSKWVIRNIVFDPFLKLYENEIDTFSNFLHPMSHELSFMNLNKELSKKENLKPYYPKDHKTDFLTLMSYELKKGNLKFQSVNDIKFHIFQIKDWYFEITYYNKSDNNRGWLISNIFEISEAEKPKLKTQLTEQTF